MKTASHGDWSAWELDGPFVNRIALSDESVKELRYFKSWDDCVNWLYFNGHKDAARSINRQVKA